MRNSDTVVSLCMNGSLLADYYYLVLYCYHCIRLQIKRPFLCFFPSFPHMGHKFLISELGGFNSLMPSVFKPPEETPLEKRGPANSHGLAL